MLNRENTILMRLSKRAVLAPVKDVSLQSVSSATTSVIQSFWQLWSPLSKASKRAGMLGR